MMSYPSSMYLAILHRTDRVLEISALINTSFNRTCFAYTIDYSRLVIK